MVWLHLLLSGCLNSDSIVIVKVVNSEVLEVEVMLQVVGPFVFGSYDLGKAVALVPIPGLVRGVYVA